MMLRERIRSLRDETLERYDATDIAVWRNQLRGRVWAYVCILDWLDEIDGPMAVVGQPCTAINAPAVRRCSTCGRFINCGHMCPRNSET